MCGIIGVLRRPDNRPDLEASVIHAALDAASEQLSEITEDSNVEMAVTAAADELIALDLALRAMPGVRMMVADPALTAELELRAEAIGAAGAELEARLDEGKTSFDDAELEAVNSAFVRLKDGVWAITHDRVRTAREIAALAGHGATRSAVEGYWSLQVARSAIDRLEVRGRDSVGFEVVVTNHGLSTTDAAVAPALTERLRDASFRSRAVRMDAGQVVFVYKAAAEIGELGDNTKAIRELWADDELLRLALSAPDARVMVLGHTRWASVGIVSEANAHPLDSFELEQTAGGSYPLVTAVLNGDVDNFADLKVQHGLRIPPAITTDAKVIPTLVSRGIATGAEPLEAFRSSVSTFEGSVAIGAITSADPDGMLLALRGSGQGLYVGLADHAFVVASEPYGVVEQAVSYLRMDGETPANPSDPIGSQGQLIALSSAHAGLIEGIRRQSYDGTELPVADDQFTIPEITTRDIDLGDAPHFFLKEIAEAPLSLHKTLRAKIIETPDGLEERVGEVALPAGIRSSIALGDITKVVAIGQGTAAVSAQCLEAFLRPLLRGRLQVEATLATELSGFGLSNDMSDALVVAVSQSGTTTDTNRTVDLVRSRGASVIAVVNRRGSDLTDRCDGVLYTSDGRDVEMSVASTKAFYAQIAAAALLSCAIARAATGPDAPVREISSLLGAMQQLPDAMRLVLGQRSSIADIARRHAPAKRYWALVGNGINAIAARELRIKLSELCYKAIAHDSTEDKKHIDLSSEPLILVCAAGLQGSTADDVAKEVAIFRAHKATPIVFASGDTERFSSATELIALPAIHPHVDFVLATMAGHLFGYEAALAIDAQAVPLREARAQIDAALETGSLSDQAWLELSLSLREPATRFFDALRNGAYDGHLEASTAVRLGTLLRYAVATVPLDTYQVDFGKIGTPAVVVEDLTRALNAAIDELTRPVDAIKHQAKTVTVGISRSDEALMQAGLVREALAAGAPRDRLTYRALRTLAALDPAIVDVNGYTRYRIEGDIDSDAIIQVVDRGGVARDITSRTDIDPVLRGTKHRAAFEREVTVALGRSDGRVVVHIPEVKDNQPTGLTLLHVKFVDHLDATTMRTVMQGYRGRYSALKDAVTETEPTFRDDLLATVGVVDLLTEPVWVLAETWTA